MPQKRSEKEQFIQCNLTVCSIKTYAMASWDITSSGIQILIFSGLRREVTNNYVMKIICVGEFVEKIHVGQLNEFIDGDDFRILDPVKM